VKTVAKLADLKVMGACECKDDAISLVVVIDGSDSFDKRKYHKISRFDFNRDAVGILKLN